MHEPALGPGQSRDHQLKIPVTPEERAAFRLLARAKCETLSVLVRQLLWDQIRNYNLAAARRLTLEQVQQAWQDCTTNGAFTEWLRGELGAAVRACPDGKPLVDQLTSKAKKGRRR